MARVVLSLFDLLAWALRWAGVDYPQFRAVLGVKLTLDGRRRFSGFQQQSGRPPRNAFAATLLMNVFLGFFVALPMIAATPLVAMTLVHAFVMVVLALALIADFSSVLLDATDNQVLQPRPISSRTILAARAAHIATYISLLAFSLAAASFIAGTIKYGMAFAPLFVVTLAANVCLVVAGTSVLYLLAMRLTSGDRLHDVILYFQVGMTIFVVGGYQIVPRLIDVKTISGWSLADRWWVYLVPPAWLAAPFDYLTGPADGPRIILTALGAIVPLAALVCVFLLASGFKEALARLEAGPATRRGTASGATAPRLGLATCLAYRPVERAAFEFLWRLTGKDRQFKLRTYPSIALAVVMGAALMLSGGEGWRQTFATLPQTQKYLFMLYICALSAPAALIHLRYSDCPEAAWIYRVLPLATPGEVLLAGWKVVAVRVVLPSFLLATSFTLAVWGMRVLPDVLLAFCVVLLICALQAFLLGVCLPFSEPFGVVEGSGRTSRMLAYMLLASAAGWLHYSITHVPYAVPVATPVVGLFAWYVLRALGGTTWQSVLAEPAATPPRPGGTAPVGRFGAKT